VEGCQYTEKVVIIEQAAGSDVEIYFDDYWDEPVISAYGVNHKTSPGTYKFKVEVEAKLANDLMFTLSSNEATFTIKNICGEGNEVYEKNDED